MFTAPSITLKANQKSQSLPRDFNGNLMRSEAESLHKEILQLVAVVKSHETLIAQLSNNVAEIKELFQDQKIRNLQLQRQLSTGVAFDPKAFEEYLCSDEFKSSIFAAIYTEAPYLCEMR